MEYGAFEDVCKESMPIDALVGGNIFSRFICEKSHTCEKRPIKRPLYMKRGQLSRPITLGGGVIFAGVMRQTSYICEKRPTRRPMCIKRDL